MVMKDKLEKFGHKRGYYAARRTFAGFLTCLCLFSMIAIPTYIASRTESKLSNAESQDVEDNDTDIQSVNDK